MAGTEKQENTPSLLLSNFSSREEFSMGLRTHINRINANQAVFLAWPDVLATGKYLPSLPSSHPP